MTNADGSPHQEPTTPVERPRYGEYLPAGSPPPYQAPPVYQAQPTYPTYPGQQQPTPEGYPGSPYYQPVPVVRTRKVADLVVTCILLALGLFGMLFGILTSADLGGALASAAAQRGVTYEATSALPVVANLIWVSHLLLFLAAVGGSIPLLVKRRVAFWLPLTAGVLAAIVYWGGIFALILGDSALVNALQSAQ
jgi:hypothetical protein